MSNMGKFRLYKVLSFLAFAFPFGIAVGVNFEQFIAFNTLKVSLYGYIVLIFLFVGFKEKMFDSAKKNPVMTMSIVMFITSYMMKSFINQLMILSLIGLIGSFLSAIIDPVVEVFYNECYKTNGNNRVRIHGENLTHIEGWKKAYR